METKELVWPVSVPLPTAEQFVDAVPEGCTLELVTKYDFSALGTYPISLLLTDEKGREFTYTASLTLVNDKTSPTINGLRDLVAYVGGGVSYLEDLNDGDESITNLLNDHDTGRLIQQSYYGTSSAPYKPAKFGDTLWSYNPVQGGDQYGNKSKLVDFSISEDGKSIWVKCQPLDWAPKNQRTPSYMENTYTIADGYIKVDNRFIDFSGYTHNNSHQELPAFYTISYLSDFVFYNGTKAWQGDELTVKKDLKFWAGNSDAYFNVKSKENWCAWVAPTGYGVGVYTPIAEILLAGRHEYNGSKDAGNNATNYVAPLITYTHKSFDVFE